MEHLKKVCSDLPKEEQIINIVEAAMINYFKPEYNIDPLFSRKFYEVMEKGVEIYPMLLGYENKNIIFRKEIKILEKNF